MKKAEEKQRPPFSYKIIKRLAILTQGQAISKEVNIVQFSDGVPRLDVRVWKRKNGEEQLLKGITLTDEEAVTLEAALHEYNQAKAAERSGT